MTLGQREENDTLFQSFQISDNVQITQFKIEYSNKDKGKIIFYFDNKNYNLSGWEISDLNNNSTVFKISNLSKNHKIDEKIFIIPSSD